MDTRSEALRDCSEDLVEWLLQHTHTWSHTHAHKEREGDRKRGGGGHPTVAAGSMKRQPTSHPIANMKKVLFEITTRIQILHRRKGPFVERDTIGHLIAIVSLRCYIHTLWSVYAQNAYPIPTAHKLCLVNLFTNPTSNRAPVNPRKHADCTFPSLTTHFPTDLAVHNSTLWRICSTSRRKRTPPRRVPAI